MVVCAMRTKRKIGINCNIANKCKENMRVQ